MLSVDICSVVLRLLAVFHPSSHLKVFVLLIGCMVCILGKVDVQALHLLCIVVISDAKKNN